MKDVVIIPGLRYKKSRFRNLMKHLSSKYKIHFFDPDYSKRISEITNDLKLFIRSRKIEEASFITHSFGSIIFLAFLQKKNCKVDRLIEMAPMSKGSRLLDRCIRIPLSRSFLQAVCFDYSKNLKQLLKKEYVGRKYVIAGARSFHWSNAQYFIIPFILRNTASDGLVFVEETRKGTMERFEIVNEVHHRLPMNPKVIDLIGSYLDEN